MAEAQVRRLAPGLPVERGWLLPSSSQQSTTVMLCSRFWRSNYRRPALAVLLAQARKKTMRVWAEHSPFDLKDALKRRGYRWSARSDCRPRSWYVDVDESMLDHRVS